jgi:hypothetical protein
MSFIDFADVSISPMRKRAAPSSRRLAQSADVY